MLRDIKEMREKIIAKHCKCCDFSKHFYDEELDKELESLFNSNLKEQREGELREFEEILSKDDMRGVCRDVHTSQSSIVEDAIYDARQSLRVELRARLEKLGGEK